MNPAGQQVEAEYLSGALEANAAAFMRSESLLETEQHQQPYTQYPSSASGGGTQVSRSQQVGTQQDLTNPVPLVAPTATASPTTGSNAPCTIPMWNKRDYVCYEHRSATVGTFFDSIGARRKKLEHGRDCTVQCPKLRWYQTSKSDLMFCNHGSWVFDDGSDVQKIECVTTKYMWRYIWILFLLIMFVVWLQSQCAALPKTEDSAKQEAGQDMTIATQNAGDSAAPVGADAAAVSAAATAAPTTSGTTAPTGAAAPVPTPPAASVAAPDAAAAPAAPAAAPAAAPDPSPDAQPVTPQ